MSSLKTKTISGLTWSFIDNIAQKGLTFIIGIILARLLLPEEFGIIGMITIFIAVSTSFINSGFGSALIRKQKCTDTDYSTVFYFNLATGIFFYILLFFLAPVISHFFNEPQLKLLIKVLGIVLIIDAFTIIQRTILTKQVNFKLQTKISVIASLISGIIGIIMAFKGFGVWSLVAKQISQRLTNSILLWTWNKWKPLLIFSRNSFRQLFSFGYKLLISGLIDTIYRNVYLIVIGKYFSAQELGFYTRANQFKSLPSQNISQIIERVSYPVLANMQDNPEKLRLNYKRLIKTSMLITFTLMLGMAAAAEPMVIALIGEKWRPSIGYLQLLCFAGMMYPLHSLNLNMLQIQGRSDLFLKLEVYKKILAVPIIIIGIFYGVKIMILGMIVNSFFAYYLNSYWSGKFLNYSTKEQILDILPAFAIALINALAIYLIGILLPMNFTLVFISQILFGGIFIIFLCEIFKLNEYKEIKDLVRSYLLKFYNGRKK